MATIYFIISGFLILTTLIPFIDHPYWVIRILDFGKVQFLILQISAFLLGIFLLEINPYLLGTQVILLACILYNSSIFIKFIPIYTRHPPDPPEKHSHSVTLVAANVYQFNKSYQRFIQLVQRTDPDIIFTAESNKNWENAMAVFEKNHPHFHKIPLENTYGMHFYTRLKIRKLEEHYFTSDDIPSIEAELETRDGYTFVFFGIHPPPPSNTEEPTSKERDGELLSISKKVRAEKQACIAVGDFNNVAWAKSSVLFKKTSGMIDPRVGRGLIATFHAKYRLLRFPIDQLYHTPDIIVNEFRTLEYFGSDHFPVFCRFSISEDIHQPENQGEKLKKGDMKNVNQKIRKGKAENGNRSAVAEE